jgi:ABC-type multidrug transport system fused ATPase/permease subunit
LYQFADSTLLVIAHRLSTIADFDKILVMSEGKAVEFDSPAKLLEKKGLFYDMVQQSGEKEQLEKIIKAG